MALFEQRISEEDVTAAREKIAAGVSLRAAAAAIPCAPSTLSVRIRKAEAAEDEARARAGIGDRRPPLSRPGADRGSAASGAGEGAVAVGPVEVLRGALQATRANGQPDWPTRVSAARALAALRPDEVEPTPELAPATVVYDLPPGSPPILHQPQPRADGLSTTSEGPVQSLPKPGLYLLTHGDEVISLVDHPHAGGGAGGTLCFLNSREEAANIVRAFGGDPAFLETLPDTEPQPETS